MGKTPEIDITKGSIYNNLLINGGCRLSQRGDFSAGPAAVASTYWIDRYLTNFANVTATRQLFSSGSPIAGTNIARLSATSTATGFLSHEQRVENTLNQYNGKQVVLSGYVKSNNAFARLRAFDGVDAHPGDVIPNDGQFHYVELPFTVNPAASSIIYCQAMIYDEGNVPITTGDYIDFVGMKLEFGNVATQFVARPIDEELAKAQRYFWKTTSFIVGQRFFYGAIISVSQFYSELDLDMRTTPIVAFTLTELRNAGFAFATISCLAYKRGNKILMDWVTAGAVAGDGHVRATAVGASVSLDAEL